MADPIQLPEAERQQYENQFASGPAPINPIKDFDAPELAHLATQDPSFNLVDEFRRNPDLWKDASTVQKVADAHNLIKQRGFQVGDIAAVKAAKEGHPLEAAGAVVKPAYEIAKGFGKQLWNYATAAAVPFISAAGDLTGQGPGFSEELGNIGQRAVAENIAGTEQAVTDLGEMGSKAVGKIGRAVGLAKPLSDYTPEEKAKDLWNAVGSGETQADIAKGHGGFLSPVGGEVIKGLEEAGKPVRPEETAVTAAGDPFSWWAFGKAFQGAGKVVPPGLSRAGGAVTQAAGEKLVQGAGKVAEVAGKAAKQVAGGAEGLGKVVEVAAPLIAGGKALVTGDWGNVFEEGLGGKFGGQALEKVGEYSKQAGEKLSSLGEQISGAKPVVSPTAQLARDVISTAPGAAGDIAKGAAFDLGLGATTSETPQDTEGLGVGTVFGALGAGKRTGGKVLRGQLIAPREYGIKTPQASSGQFPELDAMHNAAFRDADPAVKARLNALRLFAKTAADGTDIFHGDAAGIESALTKQGVNPEQAKQISEQEGFFTAALTGKDGKNHRVIIVKNVDAAPHEALHAIQDVIGEQANRETDDIVKKAYANQWDAEGTDYAQRLTGGNLPGTWQETVLDKSGWGQDAAKTKIYTDIGNKMRAESGAEPRPADVQAQAQHELGRLTDEALARNPSLDPTEVQSQIWRDVLSPEEAKNVADTYIARELAAENFDLVLKHTGGTLNDPKGILPYFAKKVAQVMTVFGAEPLAGSESQIGQIAPKTPVVEAVRAMAKSRTPEVTPQVTPQVQKGPKPVVPVQDREVNAQAAQQAADNAPNVPTAKGGRSPRELLGQVAEAIAQGTGIKINYLSAPDEPAAATTSNREVRRQIIEAYRTMPPEARALWEKSFFPDRVITTKGGGYQVQGWAPEVFASNAHKMAATLAKIGPEAVALSPYQIDPDTHTFTPDGWKRLYEDAQKFIANQQAGRTGAGESLVVPKEMAERGVYAPQVKGPGIPLDQHSADFINTLFNFKLPETPRIQKGKLPLNVVGQEVSEATQAGRTEVPVRPRGEYAGAEALKQGIAGRAIAEVNPVRNQIEAAAQKAGVAMPSMIEAIQKLNLDNIKEIEHAPELPEFRGNTLTLTAGFQPQDWRVIGQLRGQRKETTIKAESETEARTKAAAQGYRVEKVTSMKPPTALTVGMFQPKTDFARKLADEGFEFNMTGEVGNRRFSILKDGKEVGMIHTPQTGNDTADVSLVDVNKDFRNRDLGEALYREAATQLQADGVKQLTGLAVHPAPVKIREKVFGPGNTSVEETGVPDAHGVYPKEAVSRIEPGMQFQPAHPESEEFKTWFSGSKVVDNEGNPLRVLHGTLKPFTSMSVREGNPELFAGRGLYFSDNPEDINRNYANQKGYDPTLRKAARSLELQKTGITKDEADSKAENEIPTKGIVYPAFLNLKNPAVLIEHGQPDYETKSTFFNRENSEDIQNSLTRQNVDPEIIATVNEKLNEGPLSAYDLHKILRGDSGDMIKTKTGEIFKTLLKDLGFDGLKMQNVAKKWTGVEGLTNHYVAYDPGQVRSMFSKTQLQPKPPVESMDWMKSASDDDFTAATQHFKGRFGGGPTGWAFEVGANAKTPEDLHALRSQVAVWKDLGREQLAAHDINAAQRSFLKSQLAREAFEAATGTTLEGKPTEASVGFIRKYSDPNYNPPMPGGQAAKTTGQFQPKTYVIRHGSTEMNNEAPSKDKIRGHINVQLSPKGRKEAEEMAKQLEDSGITKIYASDLDRTMDTALKLQEKTGAAIVPDPELRPWKFGPTIEGKSTKAMLPRIQQLIDNPDKRPPDGETFNEFKDRFLKAFHRIQDAHPDDSTAIVTHYRGTKLLDSWRKTGTDNDTIDMADFAAQRKTPPGSFEVVDKKGAALETGQAQPAKRKDEFKFLSGGPSGISKSWILPNGTPEQLGGMWHHHWLAEDEAGQAAAKKAGLTIPPFEGSDTEGVRESALRKGFVRVNYTQNSGTMTVEGRAKDWHKQKDSVMKMVESNIGDVDNIRVNVLDDAAKKLVDSGSAQLFNYDTEAEKLQHIPFITEGEIRGQYQPSRKSKQEPEAIESPAIELQSGRIITGTAHSYALDKAKQLGMDTEGYTPGFVTDRGRFVDRREAMTIASNVGQLDTSRMSFPNTKLLDAWDFQNARQFQPAQFSDKGFEDKLQSVRGGQVGGITFNPDGTEWTPPATPVDIVTLASVNVPAKDLSREKVLDALGPYADLLDEPNIVAGVFSFSKSGAPTVSIDVNAVVDQKHRKNSLDFAKQNDQVAIWDADKQEEVRSGGAGNTRLSSVGEITDALSNLTRGKPVDVDEILRQNRPSMEQEPELPGMGKRVLGTQEQSNMTKADLAAHFPESVVPRRRDEPIPSDIKGSPLFKEAGSEDAAVRAFARKLVEFSKEWESDPRYKSGLKWYSEFVPQLKEKFGKDSPIMAELLAATSPQTAPEQNYAFAVDALAGIKSGRFDKIRDKYEEGLAKLNDGTWERWYNRENNAGRIINPPESPTPAAFLEHWVDKFDLKPRQSNGKLYGISSIPVLQVMARQWLQNTSGPKTQNFVQNLLGTGHEATIDLWADRTMRRVGYSGFKDRWRILPKNSSAVTDADFEFSQKAFAEAAKQLGIKPDALQGGLWFAEKAHWNNNGWSRLDLGDYRKEIPKTEALQAGVRARERRVTAEAKTKPMETAELPITVEPRNIR